MGRFGANFQFDALKTVRVEAAAFIRRVYNACRRGIAMKLNVKALAFAGAILWGGCVFLMGIANLIWAGYGVHFLNFLASLYPGYSASRSFGEVVIVTLYALADGMIGSAIFAWLYNCFA